MIASQEINDRTIYEPCLPDGEGHHQCVGAADGDTPAIGPCECTCHRGVVVLNADSTTVHVVIAAQDGVIEGANLFRDLTRAADYAREAWRAMTGSDEPDPDSLTGTHDDEHDVWLFTEQLDLATAAEIVTEPNERTPEGFVRLVADMTIEGECQDHGHAIDDCGEEQCCNADCDTYEPSGNDDEITTLYELIATARRLLQIG